MRSPRAAHPLNPVLLIASDSAGDRSLPDNLRAVFRMIADNISLQARLIDDLLDFSRIIHGKITLERRPLDLNAIVRAATATIQDEISAKGIKLTFSLSEPAPVVDGDPVRLRQVFWNVLKNALKFTPAGGRIEIGSPPDGTAEQAEIRIRDTGIGMGAAELARIFHPFVQGRHAAAGRREAFGGLGLGLSLSRMLVECHGGSIAADSPGPDLGSTVTVRLPRRSPAHPESGRADEGRENGSRPMTAIPTQSSHRVLFVEDHEPTRETLTRLLQRRGYDVRAAPTIRDALRYADEADFDVLISDLGLPDGDGCESFISEPAQPAALMCRESQSADLGWIPI